MAIGEVRNREVVIAERSMTVVEAAQLMRQHHVGDIVVVEEVEGRRRPIGIVTDRDIVVEVVAADLAAAPLPLGDILRDDLSLVEENEGVFETIRIMRARGVRRMPVVDREGWLVGIITLDDLLELLAEEMGEMVRLISRERQREQESLK